MAKTKKPTGLKITRNGLKLTASWTIASADHGAGQELQRKELVKHYNPQTHKYTLEPAWVPISITKTETSKVFSSTYAGLESEVQIRLRGRRKAYTTGTGKNKKTHTPEWSDWVYESKTLYAPSAPSVSLAQGSSDGTCTLSWSVSTSATDAKPFDGVEWQTRIINGKNKAGYDGIAWSSGHTGWQTGTGGASGSATISNNVEFTATNSWTRVVRVRSLGAIGDSSWSYACYTYATPKQATVTSATATKLARGYSCNVKWSASVSFAYPIDSYQIQYLIDTPENTALACPSGASWTDASGSPFVDSNGTAQYTFSIDNQVSVDQCLWFRVNTVHGTRVKYGTPYQVLWGGLKPLASGGALDVDYDSERHVLTLSAENPSTVPGTFVRVMAPDSYSNGSVSRYIYIDLDGETVVNNYTAPIGRTQVDFAVYVVGGNYTSSSVTRTFYPAQEASAYAYAPTVLNLSKGSTTGTAVASWNLTVADATAADISYSDDPNAWSSGTETVVQASSLTGTTVANLQYDTDYLFRVRLQTPRGETRWSDAKAFKLKATDLPRPTSLAVAQGTAKDSIKVTWDWRDFSQADAIEISWADDANAWNSSSEPSEQEVLRTGSNGTFYISDLERDKTWYIQARYKTGEAYSGYIRKAFFLAVNPVAPTNVSFATTSVLSTPRLSWTWSWDDAESAEITWSSNSGAWTATEGLSSTTVDRSRSYIDIPGLEMGKVWYARVKFIFDKWSSQSAIVSVDLRTDPEQPAVRLSLSEISAYLGKTDVSWTYSCEDGKAQSGASVWLVQEDGTLIRQLASVADERTSAVVYSEGLAGNTDYWISVQTTSATGKASEWSAPVKLRVTSKPTATITQSSLEDVTLTDSEGDEYTVTALTQMPLTLSVTGIGTRGTVTAYVERAEDYFLEQPDENQFRGHQGEVILIGSRDSDGDFTFGLEDMLGSLDDTARYTLTAVVKDYLGQTDEASIDFTVLWDHQALMPEATVIVDQNQMITKITPTAPTGAEEGDSVDIYRLSADRPELIVQGAIFGTTYVDPYPSFGPTGGHRIVYRTAEGDYTTDDNHIAFLDFRTDVDAENPEEMLAVKKAVIDFGGERVVLQYNVDLSSKWSKDFTETQYLGGSVQGDWNPAVSRTGSVTGVAVTLSDQATIDAMRRLATYAGVCHVRTPDGSSYAADVQVSEDRSSDTLRKIASFSLDITRVDPEGYDGVTLAEWEANYD
jgi:hypothetical protein